MIQVSEDSHLGKRMVQVDFRNNSKVYLSVPGGSERDGILFVAELEKEVWQEVEKWLEKIRIALPASNQ